MNPPSVSAALRLKAAARIRAHAQKHLQFSTSLLKLWDDGAQSLSGLAADAVENGKLKPGEWIANAFALSIESVGQLYDVCSLTSGGAPGSAPGSAPGGVAGSVSGSLVFVADDSAECVGPLPLPGVTSAEVPKLIRSDLTNAAGQTLAAACVNVTVNGGIVFVSLRDLTQTPLPAGTYKGKIERPNGVLPQHVSEIVLLRL